MLFDNRHAEVYAQAFKRIARVVGNFEEVVSYAVVANFQKLMSLKLADLLLGEEPTIKAGEPDGPEQKTIELIKEFSKLQLTSYMAAIDVSRYGDGLFNVYLKDGKGFIDVTQPPIWFPVVSPDNIKDIQCHVLAWTYTTGSKESGNELKFLKVRAHFKGYYEETVYNLLAGLGSLAVANPNLPVGHIGGDTIQSVAVPTITVKTGLSNFAVVQIPNVLTSDRVTGIDDYEDVDSIISELLVRISQMERIFDKHTNPSMQGPSSAMTQDAITGQWILKAGNYFPRDSKEDPETSYIIWDAKMTENFKMIEQLTSMLATISEMGTALFGEMEHKGFAATGTALRFRFVSPLAKVKRVAMTFRPALVEAIKLASELKGKDIMSLRDTSISIHFQDGLPNDPKEEAEVIQIRSANKQTKSVKSILMEFDGLNEKEAQAEIDQMADETEALAAFAPIPFGGGGAIDENGDPIDPAAPTDPTKKVDPLAKKEPIVKP